ncbi:MAG: hypothetical protein IIA19_09550 [Thaumarchaeota archaeon]|nr:hypothetical protein [Nitrososphaerota archaeon]
MSAPEFPIVNRIAGFPVKGLPTSLKSLLKFNFGQNVWEYASEPDLAHGEIFMTTPNGGQSISQTYVKITQFDTNGAFNKMTVDQSQGTITCTEAADYDVDAHISITGGNNRIMTIAIFVDGVEQPSARAQEKLGTGTNVTNITIGGIITCLATSVIDIRIKQDAGTDTVNLKEGNIHMFFI